MTTALCIILCLIFWETILGSLVWLAVVAVPLICVGFLIMIVIGIMCSGLKYVVVPFFLMFCAISAFEAWDN